MKTKGTLFLSSYENLENLDLSKYNLKLHITLSIKQGIRQGFIHVPHLAPSSDLFSKTLYKWKKLIFTKEEKEELLKGKTQTWWDLYEARFITELNTRKDTIDALKRLRLRLDEGKDILIVCYCDNAKRCHRSLVGSNLERDGYKVVYLD